MTTAPARPTSFISVRARAVQDKASSQDHVHGGDRRPNEPCRPARVRYHGTRPSSGMPLHQRTITPDIRIGPGNQRTICRRWLRWSDRGPGTAGGFDAEKNNASQGNHCDRRDGDGWNHVRLHRGRCQERWRGRAPWRWWLFSRRRNSRWRPSRRWLADCQYSRSRHSHCGTR